MIFYAAFVALIPPFPINKVIEYLKSVLLFITCSLVPLLRGCRERLSFAFPDAINRGAYNILYTHIRHPPARSANGPYQGFSLMIL
jgi:hypothetical protein